MNEQHKIIRRSERKRSLLVLAGFVAMTFGIGSLGFMTGARPDSWYDSLAKPGLMPPDWAFSVIWPALYTLLALAGWQVWRTGGRCARPALLAYGVMLMLLAMWPVVFFGLHRVGFAALELGVLWLASVITFSEFLRISPPSSWLMLPYLLWLVYAGILNITIYLMIA